MTQNEITILNAEDEYSDIDKRKAAYALNMCMVSVSQIIDYDDLYVLEQEYEGILNNLNLEMMPKDEALLHILKQLLDTITFFRIQEGDKKILDKEYQHKMKNAIWKAVPNFGVIVAGGNPISMAVSLASQVGIGYMNYRREKAESEFDKEKQLWQLQRSAMEQFNGLRRELFATAWRLADKYKFPDEYRLTERQIKQYDDILMDNDEIRKYERLTSVKEKFIAYPPFWYHYGSTANHIARNGNLILSENARLEYKNEAIRHFEEYWKCNKYALLREDHLASACALEYIDLLDIKSDREKIYQLLNKAVKFSGNANDILQLCAMAYLRIDEKDDAIRVLRILVNEKYNLNVNAQLLSGLYVYKAAKKKDQKARIDYEILCTRVNPDYLFRLPQIEEQIDDDEINSEFGAKQEDLLRTKFVAVLNKFYDKYNVKLGKLIPVPSEDEIYTEYYFSSDGIKARMKDMQELFVVKYKAKQKENYLERLAHCNFVVEYFSVMNQFFNEIIELNCIRDRHELQELISNKIVSISTDMNSIAQRIEEKKADFNDICQIFSWTTIGFYSEFCEELVSQIDISILGMNEMSMYAMADSCLRDFCIKHGIPEPEELLKDGNEAKTDYEMVKTYFGFNLLGQEGEKIKREQECNKKIRDIIRRYIDDMNLISKKASAYLYDSKEFNLYFEKEKLKQHKDILQKAVAVYDDKSMDNVDIIFTLDSIVPVIKNKVQAPVSYFSLAGDAVSHKYYKLLGSGKYRDREIISAYDFLTIAGPAGLISKNLLIRSENNSFRNVTSKLKQMFDEICLILMEEIED